MPRRSLGAGPCQSASRSFANVLVCSYSCQRSTRIKLKSSACRSLIDPLGVMDSFSTKPTRIGAYDIIDVIGRGGMGTVFRGNDPRIGRAVAIKMLTAAADDPDLLTRFYREAKYTGNLNHQNIVTVYELGHQDGVPYLVMEYLEGVSLDAVIASGRPMQVFEKLAIILQVCSGLTYAHQRGLVHRDIKPANIVLLADGTAKIVDFGIALLGGTQLTRTGQIVGSLNYMSPEQLNGNVEVDVRTDVYSTGVVLFQLLTGILPFEGGSTGATLKKIIQDPPPLLTSYMKDCPAELEAILQKSLAKNRDERYATPEDFSLDLARLHKQYEGKLLEQALRQAAESLQRKDFTAARQLVVQVLRAAPQNAEASELLRLLKQGQEQQQREQQVLQLQMKAEEAFRKNQLEESLKFVEQGTQLDPTGTVFPGLRDAIREAQAKTGNYLDALKRAEEALRSGNLEAAKQSVMDAQAILPDDATARALAGQIIARLEQQLREQKAGERQKQFASVINTVEKAMADARMLLFLGEIQQALQTLDKAKSDVQQLPPRWVEQFEALKKEVLDKEFEKKEEQNRSASQPWGDTHGAQTVEIPAPAKNQRNAAGMVDAFVPGGQSRETLELTEDGKTAPDILFPRTKSRPEDREVAAELREFLETERAGISRSVIWLGIAVLILAGVFVWLYVRPKLETESRLKSPGSTALAGVTYAEINAEPWATVIAVTPANGDAQNAIGQVTPLRINLLPGQYSVMLQGPNHEEKRIDLTVPQQGGTSGFAFFNKPDLNRIVDKN